MIRNITMPTCASALAAALAIPAAALDHAGSQAGTWRLADSPHVVTGNVTVPAGRTLQIEAGSLVLFDPGTSFTVDGTLVSSGSASAPVALLSREMSPNPGDWQGLSIGASGAAWLNGTIVGHAVTGVTVMDGGSLDALDTEVSDSLLDGVSLMGLASAAFHGCTLERNGGAGLRVAGGAPFLSDCTMRFNDFAVVSSANAFPVFSGTTAAWNRSLDGVLVDTSAPVSVFGSWRGGSMPFVIPDGATLSIASGVRLALDGAAVVQLGLGARISVDGELSVASGSLLTSLFDDEAAGDTNRDGGATAPSKGDWNGIDVQSGGLVSFTSTELRHATDGLRVLAGGTVVMVASEVHQTTGRGLALGTGVTAFVQDSFFHDNDTGIQVSDTDGVALGLVPGNEPTGGGNSFHCNASFDLENTASALLQARRNYWGGAPPDISRVAGMVDTDEFLISAPASAVQNACLTLGLESGTDLRFDWSELSGCASYQLTSAAAADGVFGAFTAPTVQETHLEAGGALADGSPVTFFRLASDF